MGHEALDEEFDLGRTLIEARTAAGLSQSQLARRMKTSQSYIARVEGRMVRSTDRLELFPQATHTRLRIVFEPQTHGKSLTTDVVDAGFDSSPPSRPRLMASC